MRHSIPDEWRYAPPNSLVVGIGAYALALSEIIGTSVLSFDRLEGSPELDPNGCNPLPLDNLKQVFLVVPDSMPAAESLRYHRSVWSWIEKLSSAGDQHDLAFVFVLPPSAGKSYEESLAAGLGLPMLDPATTGQAVWNRSGSLSELLKVIDSIQPRDLMWLRARQAADGKRRALAQLLSLPVYLEPVAVQEVAHRVLDGFRNREYLLDMYCRPPSHQNGNELRKWLRTAVTGPVTQDWWEEGRQCLDRWLLSCWL